MKRDDESIFFTLAKVGNFYTDALYATVCDRFFLKQEGTW